MFLRSGFITSLCPHNMERKTLNYNSYCICFVLLLVNIDIKTSMSATCMHPLLCPSTYHFPTHHYNSKIDPHHQLQYNFIIFGIIRWTSNSSLYFLCFSKCYRTSSPCCWSCDTLARQYLITTLRFFVLINNFGLERINLNINSLNFLLAHGLVNRKFY